MPSTPTTGVHFSREDIQKILTSLKPPQELSSFEATELGFNNRIYLISTACGREVVLKAGGRYWKRQKTEAEVAGLLALDRTCRGVITVPRVLGFSSRTGGDSLPWEWILLQRLPGKNMGDVWGTFDEGQKEDVARKLGNIVVRMQSITPAELGFEDKQPQYGNLSLTWPEDGATAPGHDHASIDLSPSSSQPLYISHILNGPPPSATYLSYAGGLIAAAIESLELPAQCTRFAYQLNAERLPRLRDCVNRLRIDPPPLLRTMDTSQRWRPVFTHGDLLPQNMLVHAQDTVSVIDLEWCGFFPPHIEWDAGLNTLVTLLASSEGGRAKEVFLDVIHEAGASTPWSVPPAEWEIAMKLMRLAECVVPWWLGGYPDDGGKTEARKEVTEKRDTVVLELDELLDFFGS